jgi:hypothetical protein
VWLPTCRLLTGALVATPPVKLTGLPRLLPSITNWTVPVGVPLPAAPTVTVAAKVMLWPKTEGFVAVLTTVLVVALATVWVREPVLPAKMVSPE